MSKLNLEILALANYVDFSKDGKFNIVGIFDQITADVFPTTFLRAFIAFTITGITPNIKLPAIVAVYDPSNEVVLEQKVELNVGRNGKSNFYLESINLSLPTSGKYKIAIIVDKKELGRTFFEVGTFDQDVK